MSGGGWWGAVVMLMLLGSGGVAAAPLWGPPRADLWPRWARHAPADSRRIDHQAWDRFLARYLDPRHPSGIHRVSYRTVTGDDRRELEAYLSRLQAIQISTYTRREQLPFWINLYNAATVKLVLDHYPVASIRRMRAGLLSSGPWDMALLFVEGERLSLNDVEHRVLRPIWRDPRLHYAVNCASLGCPNLAPVAYTRDNAEQLLTEGAVAYVNHPRGVVLLGGRLRVSSLYAWFEEDFGGSRAGVLQHLRQHARVELGQELERYQGPLDHAYDWALNEP